MPGMITDLEGDLVAAFGCMGGYMQPQGHIQVGYGPVQKQFERLL